MPAPTGRESDKFMLRLPEGMRDQLRKAAEESGRSMNAEIVSRLEASLGLSVTFLPDAYIDRLIELERAMKDNIREMKQQLETERTLRAKAEDRLLQERIRDEN